MVRVETGGLRRSGGEALTRSASAPRLSQRRWLESWRGIRRGTIRGSSGQASAVWVETAGLRRSGVEASRPCVPVSTVGRPASTREAESLWRAAVTARRLETPRSLPASWGPLVRRLTGRPTARFTTGPATRVALTTAGARAAITGDVLHLARTPVAEDRAAVAHELAHSRTLMTRPRFWLRHESGDGDSDEGHARASAEQTLNRAPDAAAPPAGATPTEATPIEPQAAPSAGSETETPAGAPAQIPVAQPIDVDALVDRLEQRLIREIERRGGRFSEVF